MALPPSGPITMGMINTELGRPSTQVISLNEASVRALAQVPAGMISLSNFYGKSAAGTLGWSLGFMGPAPGLNNNAGSYEWNMANDTGQAIPATTPTGALMTGNGNSSSKGFLKGGFATGAIQMWSFPFSTKTFVSIANAPYTGPASMSRTLQYRSRMQTETNYYNLANGSLPGPAANSTQRYSKFNFSSEVYTVINQQYAVLSPAPSNDWATTQISWSAAKNYNKGYQGAASQFAMQMSYPTDTASATWGGLSYQIGSGGLANFRPMAAIQNAENGYSYGGLEGVGGVPSVSMGKQVFSTGAWTRSYQSMNTSGAGRFGFMGLQNPSNGYLLGGSSLPSPTAAYSYISEIRKYQFSTETLSTVPSSMPQRNLTPYEVQSAPILG